MTISHIGSYDRATTHRLGSRAIVLGGSIAGMCAARVLSDAFDEVLIIERDTLPDGPAIRDGAPQTGHPHALLEAGRAVFSDLFRGFESDVLDHGGLKLDMVGDIDWYDRGGIVKAPSVSLPALYGSRPLFEHVVRKRIRGREGIRIREGCHVIDYLHDDDEQRVTGIRLRNETGTIESVEGHLTVDATGRTSRTPNWLTDNGYPEPDVERVTVDVTYSTVQITRPTDVRDGILIAPEPHRPRGAAMLPIENDRWEVLLQGLHGERAPANRETFIEWAEDLPLDVIGTRLREQDWQSEIRRYPFPASVRRHYETLSHFPDGLVVTGDAVASFNPIYGQGMSVSALDALALHRELADGLGDIGPRFFRRISDAVDDAWLTAVGSDFVFDATTGPKPTGIDVLNRYVDRLVTRAHDDGVLTEAFMRVFRMERRSTSLLRPRILWRVLRPQFA
jgi:2-polyprenyl-6-methoxyphenol hydroxylase-like FAD-dependent oxidoreductase